MLELVLVAGRGRISSHSCFQRRLLNPFSLKPVQDVLQAPERVFNLLLNSDKVVIESDQCGASVRFVISHGIGALSDT
jgi:hypothetical protein